MKKGRRILCVILSGALLFAGCTSKKMNEGEEQKNVINTSGKEKNEHQSNLDMLRPMAYGNVEGLDLEPGTYISVIGKANGSHAYWKAVEEGAKRAEEDINRMLGYKGADKVKVVYSAPEKANNAESQIYILDEELALYPSAIGIALIDVQSCTVQFESATDQEIPIVAFDSGTNYQGIVAKCSTDNEAAARTAAAKLSDAIEENGEILIFSLDSSSESLQTRVAGFQKEIAQHYQEENADNVYHMNELEKTKQEMAAKQWQEENPLSEADIDSSHPEFAARVEAIDDKSVIKYILEQHPQAKGIFATSAETTKLVLEVLEQEDASEAMKALKVVGFDASQKELSMLENEQVVGVIIQNPYAMGYATVVAAARAILVMGNEAVIDSGYTWVTKDNMEKKTIQKMLY